MTACLVPGRCTQLCRHVLLGGLLVQLSQRTHVVFGLARRCEKVAVWRRYRVAAAAAQMAPGAVLWEARLCQRVKSMLLRKKGAGLLFVL